MELLAFQNWLVRNDRHKNTVSKHLKNLRVISRSITSWSFADLEEFLLNLKLSGRKGKSINRYIDTIKVYDRFLGETSEIQEIRYFKEQPSVKGTLSDEEVEAIINLPTPYNYPEAHQLWSFFFYLCAYTGARMCEIANLRFPDCFDFGSGVLVLEYTKTGVPRRVPIPPRTREWIEKIRPKNGIFFVSSKGKQFNTGSWYHEFKKRKDALGIRRTNVTTNSFRHSFCSSLLNEDVNIHKVAKIMGHDIRQTATYEHLTTKDIIKASKKHPLIRKSLSAKDVLDSLVETINSYGLEKDSRFRYSLEVGEGGLRLSVDY